MNGQTVSKNPCKQGNSHHHQHELIWNYDGSMINSAKDVEFLALNIHDLTTFGEKKRHFILNTSQKLTKQYKKWAHVKALAFHNVDNINQGSV